MHFGSSVSQAIILHKIISHDTKRTPTPVIVTFANQKGGVGKTTLCVTFANYLVAKGVNVIVVDTDLQQSIFKNRKADIKKYGEASMPYDVIAHNIADRDGMISLTEKLHNEPSIEVALFDSPGTLTAAGLVALLVNSDIIVVPYHYDDATIDSTGTFILFIEELRRITGMKARLFLIPNLNDRRVGTRDELIFWDETRDSFAKFGYVTPKITRRADMERYSTVAALDRQLRIVSPVYDKIYTEIFDSLEPYRKRELSGIQKTENLLSKKKTEEKK